MASRFSFIPVFPIFWVSVFALGVPVTAQDAVFSEDFEWGDTADWTVAVPTRCDRIDTFDRSLSPSAEVHVATWGNDNTGDGSTSFPYATVGRGVQDATPGTAVRVHAGTYSGDISI